MNRTGRLALIPAMVLLCSGATFGQLTDASKKAPNPDNAAIQAYVDAAVKNITSDDPDKQATGRDNLAKGAELNDQTAQASPQYLDAYGGAVAKALLPLTKHEDMRVRLNAAIANARVAERAGNARLADVTVRFINDKTEAVALWGVKAARAMLPTALAKGGNHPVVAALVQAAQKFMFGPIVAEVYDALGLNVLDPRSRPQPNALKAAVPQMLRVFKLRVGSYGAAVPPDPAIDNVASEFLSFGPVWQQMNPAQRVESLQTMADLISFAGQYAQLMEGDERQALLPVFKRTGAAIQVIGDSTKNPPVSNAAKEVQRVSTGMDGTEIVERTTAVTDALRQAFPGVKPSPKLQLGDAPEADAEGAAPKPPPPANGKAPPTPPAGGAAGGGAGRGGQSKSAGPSPDVDAAQQAGDSSQPADAADAPAPQRPAPPSR